MTIALVPVKRLAESKSRLLPELEREQLEALSLSMLRDVLGALAATPSIRATVVVTPDETAASEAEACGATGLLLLTPGLNPSIEEAARALGLGDEDALLVVLGDVAGALPDELEALFSAAAELTRPSVILAPSSDGGTSALLRTPHTAIAARFGRDSASRHRAEAECAGVAYREIVLPSLTIDLDRSTDVGRFLESQGGGAHTRAFLEALAWGKPGGPGPPLHPEAP